VNVKRVPGISEGGGPRDFGWAQDGRGSGREVRVSGKGDSWSAVVVDVFDRDVGAGRVKFEGAYGEDGTASLEEWR
jgi:hypothetical protein